MKRISILALSIMMLSAQETNISIASFENTTDYTYIVYTRSRPIQTESGPVYAAKTSDWQSVLVLRPHESGTIDILIQDPDMFGMQVKLVPENGQGKVFFLKAGLPESGDCVQNWYRGPFSVIISENEKALAEPIKYFNDVKRIRICSFREADIRIKIMPDSIEVVSEHNAKVLDK